MLTTPVFTDCGPIALCPAGGFKPRLLLPAILVLLALILVSIARQVWAKSAVPQSQRSQTPEPLLVGGASGGALWLGFDSLCVDRPDLKHVRLLNNVSGKFQGGKVRSRVQCGVCALTDFGASSRR